MERRQVHPREEIAIVDLVFSGEPGGRTRRLAASAACVLGLYALGIVLTWRFGRSGASAAAELAARVHDAIAAERAVDVAPPPPPPPVPAAPPVARAPVRERARAAPVRHAPAAPAQAGRLAAVSEAPLDFTGSAFVVGSGAAYAGGKTTASGTNTKPVTGAVAPGGTGNGMAAPSQARPVTLNPAAWTCSWPAEADALQVEQETVVIRAAVRDDGRAERVEILEDPGFGFGRQARACALATPFGPARNAAGQPSAALSPPIRVHFYR